ncbi:MAG TPA: FkbM family methyltransferase [Candidatus Sulfotelmatobacter sp.]|nr:FkbM family methyltransferase [Candidatus Sulfotelmatobacter sp.]
MTDDPVNLLWDHPAFRTTALFRALNAQPLGFVDVGARGGIHPLVAPLAGGTAVLGFEADTSALATLAAMPRGPWAQLAFEAIGLGGAKGRGTLHLFNHAFNNSLREPDPCFTQRYIMPKWRVVGQTEIELDTLDGVLSSSRRAAEPYWGEFLKLDTQGTEYEILESARATLRERTVAVVCETLFFPVYRGQKLFSDVELLLRDLGFSFYGFGDTAYRSRRTVPETVAQRERLFWSDAIFLRDPFDGPDLPFSPRQATAACASALLLGFKDFALELAGRFFPDDLPNLEAVVSDLPLSDLRA